MRRIAKTALIAGAVVLVGAGAALAATQPRVRIAANAPLKLSGSGFVAGEKVTVVVEYRRDEYRDKARASAEGTFTATFEDVRISRCGHEIEITATGSRGSRFHVTLHQLACSSR
jgi:hypothetical protein